MSTAHKQTYFMLSTLTFNRMKCYNPFQQWSEPEGRLGILAGKKKIIRMLWYLSKGCAQVAMQLIQWRWNIQNIGGRGGYDISLDTLF